MFDWHNELVDDRDSWRRNDRAPCDAVRRSSSSWLDDIAQSHLKHEIDDLSSIFRL
jgi:hypothetical protein